MYDEDDVEDDEDCGFSAVKRTSFKTLIIHTILYNYGPDIMVP